MTDPSTPTPTPVRRRWPVRWLRHRYLRRALLVLVPLSLAAAGATVASVSWVDRAARAHLYDERTVPPAPVALVLGTLVQPDGTPSSFLTARLALAQRLYAAGRVRVLLVSGDNSRPDYSEPDVMKAWLVAHGVPARQVVADYAGLDTYDSCARAKLIFGVDRAIVVTQAFHLARAVSLCRHLGIDATGVADSSVRGDRLTWYRGVLREDLACVKAVWDLTLRRDPVFLGPREHGVQDALATG